MRPRISISKKTLNAINKKVCYSLDVGDMRIYKKGQALLRVFNGIKYEIVAERFRISKDTIRRWFNDFILKGMDTFIYKTSPGRPSKLTKSQKKELIKVIKDGPEAAGYNSGCWRSPMIQHYIETRYGVLYSTKYLAELLKSLGLSFQKAAFISSHLDEEKRIEWVNKTWPKIEKIAQQKNAHILFGDEVSFPQWGSLSYTWAPAGEQPKVKTSGKRKGYKVFGLISYQTGNFFYKTSEGRFNSESYSDFLKYVMKSTRKHLIIVQDGAKYHTSKFMQEFFKNHSDRITVFQMPSYSPEYNPIEKLWKKIKVKGVHLRYFPTFEDLVNKVDEMLIEFKNTAKEVLSLFGFYRKLSMS